MKHLLATLLLGLVFSASAQNFEIGHTTITFNDPNRTGGFGSGGGPGRQIQSEIYYPADIAGTDVNVANGEFPIIAFGHGFAMVWDAYANIWEELVPEGYIIIFPRTEGGFSPSHEDFGMDLVLVLESMENLHTDNSSLFFDHIANSAGIMGHSMGGGATALAAANNTNIKTIVGLAPAETTPSAEQAAANISVPALIFSADEDAVTPAADHHQPIYDNLASSCKYFINILGGGHCYYANSNFNCDFGENASGGNITITRAEQQAIMFTYLIPWLNLYLQPDCASSDTFITTLPNDSEVTYQSECTNGFQIYDTEVYNSGSTLGSLQDNTVYQWLDCDNNFAPITGATNQSFTATSQGWYAVQLGDGICVDTSACMPLVLNVEELQLPKLAVYPNPSNGNFIVELDHDAALVIRSLNGTIVHSGKYSQGENSIEIQAASGLYLINITTSQGAQNRRYINLQ